MTDETLIPDDYWRTSFTKKVDLRSVTLDLRDNVNLWGAPPSALAAVRGAAAAALVAVGLGVIMWAAN